MGGPIGAWGISRSPRTAFLFGVEIGRSGDGEAQGGDSISGPGAGLSLGGREA